MDIREYSLTSLLVPWWQWLRFLTWLRRHSRGKAWTLFRRRTLWAREEEHDDGDVKLSRCGRVWHRQLRLETAC